MHELRDTGTQVLGCMCSTLVLSTKSAWGAHLATDEAIQGITSRLALRFGITLPYFADPKLLS